MENSKSLENILEGTLVFYWETGTEGVLWAHYSGGGYEGLHILENGDKLSIYHPDNQEKIWSGTINLKQYKEFTEHVFNHWIHSDQLGVEREVWASYFVNAYPAKLILAKKL